MELAGHGEFLWTLMYENGGQIQGQIKGGSTLEMPGELQLGYHYQTLKQSDQIW
ncbi:hypothetical protein, partial [Pectobacterium brasiliense]|uniref:hypothetical protein n=1 Tax=Pectobacterium brasiliense TaxID=180957 RepID=UPI003BF801CB